MLRLAWVICVIAGIVAISGPVASHVLRSRISSSLRSGCPACTLEIGTLRLSVFQGKLAFDEIVFKGDPAGNTVVNVSVRRGIVRFEPLSLVRGVLKVESLVLSKLHVTVSEVAHGPPGKRPAPPRLGAPLDSLPEAQVRGISIRDSSLTYELIAQTGKATIQVRDIDAEAGRFATRARLLTEGPRQYVELLGRGVLESSGHALVRVAFQPFAESNDDRIEIGIDGQSLAELNRFFEISSGISLGGDLRHALAHMALRRGNLSGTLAASYRDLSLKFHATPDRGEITSVLQNVIEGLKLRKNRPDNADDPVPPANVSARRRPYEPITQLLIRGLLDAVKKIIS